jgi:hypothetical protein
MNAQHCRIVQEHSMGKYQRGDHVKFEATDEGASESE